LSWRPKVANLASSHCEQNEGWMLTKTTSNRISELQKMVAQLSSPLIELEPTKASRFFQLLDANEFATRHSKNKKQNDYRFCIFDSILFYVLLTYL
jgi:hypothetical protein